MFLQEGIVFREWFVSLNFKYFPVNKSVYEVFYEVSVKKLYLYRRWKENEMKFLHLNESFKIAKAEVKRVVNMLL